MDLLNKQVVHEPEIVVCEIVRFSPRYRVYIRISETEMWHVFAMDGRAKSSIGFNKYIGEAKDLLAPSVRHKRMALGSLRNNAVKQAIETRIRALRGEVSLSDSAGKKTNGSEIEASSSQEEAANLAIKDSLSSHSISDRQTVMAIKHLTAAARCIKTAQKISLEEKSGSEKLRLQRTDLIRRIHDLIAMTEKLECEG